MDAETIRRRDRELLRARMLASRAQETVIASRDAIARSERLLKDLYETRRGLFGAGWQPPGHPRGKKEAG